MTDEPKEDTAPGPTVRWITTRQEYDKDDRLVSETVTDVRETDVPKPEPVIPGHYL
jgi:YD repeat-containing protein